MNRLYIEILKDDSIIEILIGLFYYRKHIDSINIFYYNRFSYSFSSIIINYQSIQ
jgi:hypothetical protein